MCDSVRHHRWQPTRFPCPWDPPGKNTGVGRHFLLQCMKVKSESEVTQSYPTLSHPRDCSLPSLLHPWDFPGKSTGVRCHCLLHLPILRLLYSYTPKKMKDADGLIVGRGELGIAPATFPASPQRAGSQTTNMGPDSGVKILRRNV